MAATTRLPVKCSVCDERTDIEVTVLASTVSADEETHVWDMSASKGPLEQHMTDKHPDH